LEILLFLCAVSKPQHRRIVGEKIRAYRKQAQVSQERLAEAASLNPKYVSEVECGNVNISLDALVRIAKALEIRVRDLVKEF
jgi:transcriptional regulator with XRE-family HTH domain